MIENTLALRTDHIKESDARNLELWAETKPKGLVFDTEYGFIIKVLPESEYTESQYKEYLDYDLSQGFIDVLKYAAALGCTLLHLDCDTDPIDALPTYSW
jgi:hypothetical protein